MLVEIPDSISTGPRAIYNANKSVILMLMAQLISSFLGASAKYLQTTGGLAAEQVLLGGMSITTLLCWLYMGFCKVADAPLGPRKVWWLLVLRGAAGFIGIWGYYFSLRFLPISEATVINFLSPMLAAFAIAALLRAPFTRVQKLAGLISFLGVILIAKPWHIIWPHELHCYPSMSQSMVANYNGSETSPALSTSTTCADAQALPIPTPLEHAVAIGVALLGALGGAATFVTLSWIGTAAHPMISVSYFATCTTVLSGASFLIQPRDTFEWPHEPAIWGLLCLQGFGSFAMQALQTASVAAERSSRALNMVYAQVVFALVVDKLVWNVTPGPVSIIGGLITLACVIAVAVTREGAVKTVAETEAEQERVAISGDEEMQLMSKELEDGYDDSDEPLKDIE